MHILYQLLLLFTLSTTYTLGYYYIFDSYDRTVLLGVISNSDTCTVVTNSMLEARGQCLVSGFGEPKFEDYGPWDRHSARSARICANPIPYEDMMLSEFHGIPLDVTDHSVMTQLFGPVDNLNSAAVPTVYLCSTEGLGGKTVLYEKVVLGDEMNCTIFMEVMPTVYCSGSSDILGPQAMENDWLIVEGAETIPFGASAESDGEWMDGNPNPKHKSLIIDNNQYQVYHRYGTLFVTRADGGPGSLLTGATFDGFYAGLITCTDVATAPCSCTCAKKKRSAADEFVDRVSRAAAACDADFCNINLGCQDDRYSDTSTTSCLTDFGVGGGSEKRRRRSGKRSTKTEMTQEDRNTRDAADHFARIHRSVCAAFHNPETGLVTTPEEGTMLGICTPAGYRDLILKNRGVGKSQTEMVASFRVPNDGDETGDAPVIDLDSGGDSGENEEEESEETGPDPEFLETAGSFGRCPVTYDDVETNYKKECKVVKKTDVSCGIFTNSNGPLKECIASSGSGEFNAAAAYQECRLAVCARTPKKAVCNLIKQHVDLCLGEHIMKGNEAPANALWRSASKCTHDKKPKKNDKAATVTCVNPREHKTCWNPDGCNPLTDITDEAEHHACDERPSCSDGFLWDGKKCQRAGNC